MSFLDLDEIEDLSKNLRIFSRNSPALYEFRDSDHYQKEERSTRDSIRCLVKESGIDTPIGKIFLLTHLRTWGHVFNPVSFYFVSDKNGNELCNIAEVGNTFNEQKMFILPVNEQGHTRTKQEKNFYVSPYSDLDTLFHFKLNTPAERLGLSINQSKNGNTFFRSTLSGTQTKLSDSSLLRYAIRFPFITIGILFSIHWQAFLLFLKGIQVRRKAANPHLQTDTRTYLSSKKHPIH